VVGKGEGASQISAPSPDRHMDTHTQQGDLMSLLLLFFFQNKETRLSIERKKEI
jgi:hypothetical protein